VRGVDCSAVTEPEPETERETATEAEKETEKETVTVRGVNGYALMSL